MPPYEKWISQIEKAPIEQQLRMMRERLLADTDIYTPTLAVDGQKVRDESQGGKKQQALGRPVIVYSGKCKNLYAPITNKTSNESIKALTLVLDIKRIDKVKFPDKLIRDVLYAQSGQNGVVILMINKKIDVSEN